MPYEDGGKDVEEPDVSDRPLVGDNDSPTPPRLFSALITHTKIYSVSVINLRFRIGHLDAGRYVLLSNGSLLFSLVICFLYIDVVY